MNEAIFHGYWFRPQHTWAYFNAYDSHFPSKEQLTTMKGIVFPGSRHSAYDDVAIPWIKELKDFAKETYHEFPHIKYIAICFGH